MSVQVAPTALQRCHWRAYVIVGVPVQVPVSPVRTLPSPGVPEMAGSTVLAGAAGATTAVFAVDAEAAPPALVAGTMPRSVEPTSAGVRVWVTAVCPAMLVQLAPVVSQRCHWYV